MRNLISVLLITIFIGTTLSAQVKIGDNPQNINPSSVLELESTDKVLVITRVTTAQMNAIVPSQGALCFNTDLQSVHYYDGTQWVNIGGGGGTGGPLTADPIVNDVSTIVITPTATGDNLEVAPNSIRSEQIVDGGINGVDIQDGSLGPGKLQDFSITQEKLSENSVGAFALDNDSFGVSAFNNDAGYITAADINLVSGDVGNVIENRVDGVFYNDQPLITAINQNTDAIALDDDQSAANEIQNPTLTGTEIGLTGTGGTIDIGPLLNGSGSDDQNLTLNGNTIEIENGNTIDLTPILGASGTDDQNLGPATLNASNVLTINIEGGNPTTVDLNSLAGGGGGTDDQNLTLNGNTIEIEDGNTIDLTPILGAGGSDDQNLTLNGNTIEIEDGNTIDLTPILGSGGSDDQTAAEVTYDNTTSGLTAADTQAAIDELAAVGGSDDQTAAEVTYDNTTSGLTAADTQAAIDELAVAGGSDDQTAAEVTYDNTTSGLTAADTQAAIDELAAAGGSDDQTAAEVTYDNTTSGLTAVDTQAAIDELAATGGSDDQTAAEVTYDNATSGLTAADTQAAIDELAATGGSDDQTAAEVTYDNTTSGLTADNTQGAIDELAAAGSDDQTAAEVTYDNTTSGLTATETQAAIDELAAAGSDDQTAAEVTYDNTTSGLTATETQAAIDELAAAGSDDQTAAEVTYDNTASGLTAVDTQAAIDELAAAGSDDQTAAEVTYDNTTTGLTATDTQAAIDEIVADHIGTPNEIFFADSGTGLPTGTDGLVWNPTAINGAFAAMGIGLDGGPQSTKAKVHIAEELTAGGDISYGLMLQNRTQGLGRGVGMVFSVDDFTTVYGKGALVFERADSFARGDIHFFQNNDETTVNPTWGDEAFTITRNKDIGLYGGIDIGGAGTGFGNNNQVLASGGPGAPVKWVNAGGTNLATDNLTQDNEDRTYDLNGQNLNFLGSGNIAIGNFDNDPGTTSIPAISTDKLDVNGQIRARNGFAANSGTAGQPSYSFYQGSPGDTDIGMFRAGVNQIGFSTDGIEALRIVANQNVGVGTTSPSSTLHTGGSFSTNIRNDGGGTVNLEDDDHTVILSNATTVNIPAPNATNLGRIYILKNATAAIINIPGYIPSNGSNDLAAGNVLQIQSDGTNWYQIN